jgi:hypothetical protein
LPKTFSVVVVALGIGLWLTAVPGIFTIDDGNYLVNALAMQKGRVTIANTADLPPSSELLFFDPSPWTRMVTTSPVGSSAPPLYGVIALPFSLAGWRGLVALNSCAYVVTAILVFAFTTRYSASRVAGWIAAAACVLGGFLIEYAQGVWPHALSVAVTFAGIAAIGRLIDGESLAFGAAGGFLLAVATGIRYQNALILVVAGLAAIVWRRDRLAAAFTIAAGAAGPLLASAAINHARLGSWNPISKGPGYLNMPALDGNAAATLYDPAVMFWARVVDFSMRPRIIEAVWDNYDPITGAHHIGSALQKALLQSSPWAIIGFALMAAAWLPSWTLAPAMRRQLRFFSLVVTPVLLGFAASGVQRHEGVSFNQRYLLELVPLLAVSFAWSMDEIRLAPRVVALGALSGALAVVVALLPSLNVTLHTLIMLKAPLVAAAALLVAWIVWARTSRPEWLIGAAGFCLAWALGIHLGDDVAASRQQRAWKRTQTAALATVLTDGTALVTYANKDVAIPLLFDRDIVILDTDADEGKDAPMLIRELFSRNRTVYVNQVGFQGPAFSRVTGALKVVPIRLPGTSLIQLKPSN